MSLIIRIKNIWKRIIYDKNQTKYLDFDFRVSYDEINHFISDVNLRQYYKAEVTERYTLMNNISRSMYGFTNQQQK